jgi:hypothetical protein
MQYTIMLLSGVLIFIVVLSLYALYSKPNTTHRHQPV